LDCEGAGEQFSVNLKGKNEENFFGEDEVFLTVSGQLQAEIFSNSMSKV
jgi:aspartyl/asparaginyl-tRNA synthetase